MRQSPGSEKGHGKYRFLLADTIFLTGPMLGVPQLGFLEMLRMAKLFSPSSMCRNFCFSLQIILLVFLPPQRIALALELDVKSIIARLKQQEALVGSAECRFSVTVEPTQEDAVPLIKHVCRERGNEDEYANYVYTPELASKHSGVIHWWRDGIKERLETFPSHEAHSSTSIAAFDGTVVRSLTLDDGHAYGRIDSRDGAEWDAFNRTQPYSMLFQFNNKYYSDLLSRSTEVLVSPDPSREPWIEFVHPDLPYRRFRLFFDDEKRLIRRVSIAKKSRDSHARPYQDHRFQNYRSYLHSSGDAIQFPMVAVFRFYVGQLPDGTLVEYKKETIQIDDIRFNTSIPSERFVLHFPKHARVWDGLQMKDWTTGEFAESRYPKFALQFWFFWGNVVMVGVIIFAIVSTRLRKRLRQQDRSKTDL